MPEHTPAPTPARAVYGFSLFLLFQTLFVIYVVWAFMPRHILEETFGLTYLPNKYFALYLPILVLTAVALFAFFVYPALNLSITAEINHFSTVSDSFSVRRCAYTHKKTGKMCDQKIDGNYDECFCVLHEKSQQKPNRQCFNENDSDDNDENEEEDENNITDDDNSISNYCDCKDKSTCKIELDPKYLFLVKTRKNVPSVCDLPLAEVCRQMYGTD